MCPSCPHPQTVLDRQTQAKKQARKLVILSKVDDLFLGVFTARGRLSLIPYNATVYALNLSRSTLMCFLEHRCGSCQSDGLHNGLVFLCNMEDSSLHAGS